MEFCKKWTNAWVNLTFDDRNLLLLEKMSLFKGQLNSEWIYEVIVSPKMPTKNYRDFCSGSLLEGRTEISVIFGWHFGRNDDHINLFWI